MLVVFRTWKALLWEEVGEERYICNTLQHTTTHCNSLQLTATQCNTLQHPATPCNTHQRRKTLCEEVDDLMCGVIQI